LSAPASRASSTDRLNSYFDGLRAGEAQGRLEGRAEQVTTALPSDSRQAARAAFTSGYAAGANDAFTGYDGGWTMGVPYVVFLEPGSGQIVYRIKSREVLDPKLTYYLCGGGHELCHRTR
jgi:hypothetical protein